MNLIFCRWDHFRWRTFLWYTAIWTTTTQPFTSCWLSVFWGSRWLTQVYDVYCWTSGLKKTNKSNYVTNMKMMGKKYFKNQIGWWWKFRITENGQTIGDLTKYKKIYIITGCEMNLPIVVTRYDDTSRSKWVSVCLFDGVLTIFQ